MRVLIVGAGIGGLTTALMLHRRGIAAEIFEQAPSVREVGVGINTLPHAIGELAELGLLPALERTGIRTGTLIYYNRQGQAVWREPRGLEAGHKVPQFSSIAAGCRSCCTTPCSSGSAQVRCAPG